MQMISRLFICILFLLTALSAAAQDAPKDFYDHNYAESPLKGKVPESSRRKPTGKTGTSAKNEAGTETPQSSGFSEMGITEEQPTPQPEDNTPIEGRPIPVIMVGAILNTHNQEHALKNLNELSSLATKYDWIIGPIYSIGDRAKVMGSEPFRKLMIRGGVVGDVKVLPERYRQVKLSPVWIVQTKEGEVILEAPGNFRKYFDDRGNILIPE